MKAKIIIQIAVCSLILSGCASDILEGQGPTAPPASGTEIPDRGTVPGRMTLKTDEDLADRLLEYADANGKLNEDGVALLSIPGLNVTEVSTAFHIGGKFEARQRAAGLHRWFTVSYDEEIPVSKASDAAFLTEGIEKAEPVMKMRPASVAMNDPYYQFQWHYCNTGLDGFTAGVDIKLQQAWDTYEVFGNNSVTVAVVDQGVDYDHEDLKGNMWVNEDEIPDNGKDDDGNGYADDVNGYNFVAPSGVIYPQNHGTHVAGTVSAVNNNGTGVCGVAGGRYPDQGVRIMALQIMDDRYDYSADVRQAFQYAAENGANIIQNSWSYEVSPPYMLEVDKTAIDYFIDNAGMDENGEQTGPMKGGLAVFAAGNSAETLSYPAAYDRVIAVAAVGPMGRYAYYTNYGDWVDICAPGGDITIDSDYAGVYSTFADDMYGTEQGTSMACPHVSGVAALVLSTRTQEDGFTSDNLFKLIVNTADPSIYEYNADRRGMLGSGILDAAAALGAVMDTPQMGPVAGFSTEVAGNSIIFTADVPEDARGNGASYMYVYYSTSSFSPDDLDGVDRAEFKVSGLEETEDGKVIFTLDGLEFNTTYYCAVAAANILGEPSAVTSPEAVSTKENRAPEITVDDDSELVLRASETATRLYTVSDPDRQSVEITWDNRGLSGVTFVKLSDSEVELTVNALELQAGEYECSITATDAFGLSTVLPVKFTVMENNIPVFLEAAEICLDGAGATVLFNPYDCFSDGDNDALSFHYTATNDRVVSFVETEDGLVEFIAKAPGSVRIAITATDPKGGSAAGVVNVVVRDSDSAFDIYPNPAREYVKIRTSESGIYDVKVLSSSGNVLYDKSAAISLMQPLEIGLADFPPGQYTVILDGGNGEPETGSFVKL